MRISIAAAMLYTAMIATNVQANSDIAGRVAVVNVNKAWGGIFVQLEGAPAFEPGSGCLDTKYSSTHRQTQQ